MATETEIAKPAETESAPADGSPKAEQGGEEEIDYKTQAEETQQKLADAEARLVQLENDRRAAVGEGLKRDALDKRLRNIETSVTAQQKTSALLTDRLSSGDLEGLPAEIASITQEAQAQAAVASLEAEFHETKEGFDILTQDEPQLRERWNAEALKIPTTGIEDVKPFTKLNLDAALAGRDRAMRDGDTRVEASEKARKEDRERIETQYGVHDLSSGEDGAGGREYTHKEAASLYNEGKIDGATYAKARGK